MEVLVFSRQYSVARKGSTVSSGSYGGFLQCCIGFSILEVSGGSCYGFRVFS